MSLQNKSIWIITRVSPKIHVEPLYADFNIIIWTALRTSGTQESHPSMEAPAVSHSNQLSYQGPKISIVCLLTTCACYVMLPVNFTDTITHKNIRGGGTLGRTLLPQNSTSVAETEKGGQNSTMTPPPPNALKRGVNILHQYEKSAKKGGQKSTILNKKLQQTAKNTFGPRTHKCPWWFFHQNSN